MRHNQFEKLTMNENSHNDFIQSAVKLGLFAGLVVGLGIAGFGFMWALAIIFN